MTRRFEAMALQHSLAVQKIEGWTPDSQQYNDLAAVANNQQKPLVMIHKYVKMYQTPENTAYRKPLFSRYDPYLLSGKNILRNNYSLSNQAALTQLESIITSIRIIELYKRSILGKISPDSLEITNLHVSLFGDIYPWAGYFRKVGISKGDSYFSPLSAIAHSVEQVDAGIKVLTDYEDLDKETLSHTLAELYAKYNYAHPFREGNGRTGMTWLEMTALHFGWHIDFSLISPLQWHHASIKAMPKSRFGAPIAEPLVELIVPVLSPR